LQTITATPAVSTTITIDINTNISGGTVQDIDFIAILGHNFHTADVNFRIITDDVWDFSSTVTVPTMTEVVNCDVSAGYANPGGNGWSLCTFPTSSSNNQYIRLELTPGTGNYDANIQIGCILIGKYIDMPYAPDINIKRNWNEGEGAELRENDGGMRYSNLKYRKAPNWFLAPYQVSVNSVPEKTSRAGRLVYDLGFSYLTEAQFLPSDLGVSEVGGQNPFYTDSSVLNILQYTLGAHLPFLYQWDNATSGNYDFILARAFRKSESQMTNQIWSIKMRIEEEF
ncbi:MAG: hypothetical protein ACE5D6_06825, partial [Candidatus Zixiibacteriota bacterium]